MGLLTKPYTDIQSVILFSVISTLRLSEVPNPESIWGFAAQNTCFLLTHNDLAAFFAVVNQLLSICIHFSNFY